MFDSVQLKEVRNEFNENNAILPLNLFKQQCLYLNALFK